MAGLFLQAVLKPLCPVPVLWLRDLVLPPWLDGKGLLLACSYSGETWELLHLLEEARSRGVPWAGLSSGGALEDKAREDHSPWLRLDPGRAPRSMAPAASVGLMSLFRGLVPEIDGWVAESVEGLEEDAASWRSDTGGGEGDPVPESPDGPWPLLPRDPRLLARLLASRMPLLYGYGELGEAVAYRWLCQFAENGKSAAHVHRLPELLHNEVVAWEDWGRHTPSPVVLHIVTGGDEAPGGGSGREAALRWDRMWDELRRAGLEAWRIPAPGGPPPAGSLRQILLGDATSAFVALEKGVEATPVRPIERIKGH
jgi:hypothetical protein